MISMSRAWKLHLLNSFTESTGGRITFKPCGGTILMQNRELVRQKSEEEASWKSEEACGE